MRQLSADALAIGKLALLDSRKQQVLDNAVRLNYPVHVTFVLANYRAAELLEGIELATVQALVADLTKDAPRFHEARVDTVNTAESSSLSRFVPVLFGPTQRSHDNLGLGSDCLLFHRVVSLVVRSMDHLLK